MSSAFLINHAIFILKIDYLLIILGLDHQVRLHLNCLFCGDCDGSALSLSLVLLHGSSLHPGIVHSTVGKSCGGQIFGLGYRGEIMNAALYFLAVFVVVGAIVVAAMALASFVWWLRHRGARR